MHGRLGNHLLINGEGTASEVEVEQGTVERWRLVNTSNARTMSLGISGASFKIVGTDGGRLPEPYVTDRIQMAVGQRYDVEVTYDAPGTVELTSYVLALDELGEVVEEPIPLLRAAVAASDRGPGLLSVAADGPRARAGHRRRRQPDLRRGAGVRRHRAVDDQRPEHADGAAAHLLHQRHHPAPPRQRRRPRAPVPSARASSSASSTTDDRKPTSPASKTPSSFRARAWSRSSPIWTTPAAGWPTATSSSTPSSA